MDWLAFALVVAVLIGVAAGTALVVRTPEFWIGMGAAVWKELLPILMRRMPPEQEAAWRDCQKRGGKWNPVKRRCE